MVVDEFIHRLRADVMGGHRRGEHRAESGRFEQNLAMSGVQRGFPRREHEPAAFLKRDIGGAVDQRAAVAVGDCRQGAD